MRPLRFVPFYLAWIISSSLSIVDGFVLRSAIIGVASVIGQAVPMEWQIEHHWYMRWVVRAVDPFATAILTILVFASILIFDYLYHSAIEKGTFKRKFTRVTIVQASLLVLGIIGTAVSSAIASAQ